MARAGIVEFRGRLRPKEFRVESRIRNNRLITYREQLGMSPRQMAKAIGVSYGELLQFEALTKDPLRCNGQWRDGARKIAAFHGVSPDFFWPETVRAIKKTRATVELSSEEASRLALPATPISALGPAPDEALETKALRREVTAVLATLRPREEKVAAMYFGLHGYEPHTLEEIGEHFGVHRERPRQILAKILRKLRHPSRRERLESFDADARRFDGPCVECKTRGHISTYREPVDPSSWRYKYEQIRTVTAVLCSRCREHKGATRKDGKS